MPANIRLRRNRLIPLSPTRVMWLAYFWPQLQQYSFRQCRCQSKECLPADGFSDYDLGGSFQGLGTRITKELPGATCS
jgi:hypothetical protein